MIKAGDRVTLVGDAWLDGIVGQTGVVEYESLSYPGMFHVKLDSGWPWAVIATEAEMKVITDAEDPSATQADQGTTA